jgi:YD repeat-containing protein
MKNLLVFCAAIVCTHSASGQFFYNDIIGTRDIARLVQTYRDHNVKRVTATGYDGNGVAATDFAEVQEMRENGRILRVATRNSSGYTAVTYAFDNEGRLISRTDSSEIIQSTTTYAYDAANQLISIQQKTISPDSEEPLYETHAWQYVSNGKPSRMLRILSGRDYPQPDTTLVAFLADEDGNTGDEITYRKNIETGRVYYYFDDRNRLSDIVRFNTKLARLMPDVMFEYDEHDRVIQKITTTSNIQAPYFIWRYIFDGRGLKTKEALFDNEKKLQGRIDYAYNFGG